VAALLGDRDADAVLPQQQPVEQTLRGFLRLLAERRGGVVARRVGEQRPYGRRSHADVLTPLRDGHVQVRVRARHAAAAEARRRSAGPGHLGRDREGAAGAELDLVDNPLDPVVEDELGVRVTGDQVVLGHPAHAPRLEAEPLVRRRVVVDRVLVVDHAEERRLARRERRVVAVPAVRGTAGDGALGGLQPPDELQLPGNAYRPVLSRCRRLRPDRRRTIRRQRPRGERVLVTAVVVAGADPPRPGVVQRAAPRVVPREQAGHVVLVVARRAAGRLAVQGLEVLVVHRVPQVVAHLGGLGYRAGNRGRLALLRGPHVRPVRCLNGARVGVRCVGEAPLPGRVATDEDGGEAAVVLPPPGEGLAG